MFFLPEVLNLASVGELLYIICILEEVLKEHDKPTNRRVSLAEQLRREFKILGHEGLVTPLYLNLPVDLIVEALRLGVFEEFTVLRRNRI